MTRITRMNTPTQSATHTPVHTPVHRPVQGDVDWGELGAPPPPPVLIRQHAFDIRMFDVARRLEFDDSDEEYDTGLPLPLGNANA